MHNYITDIDTSWLRWRPTNSWLCRRTVTVVMKWQQNSF